MRPSFIDIEASGLGVGSYPIEVGVAMACGGTACMIVHPEPDWISWDEEAENLHGISRKTLLSFGRPPLDAAKFLNRLMAEQVVYSDAWGNDSCWLALLFERAGIAQHFRLESLRSLLSEEQASVWHQVKDSVIVDTAFPRHRASNDALILQHTYCRVVELVNS